MTKAHLGECSPPRKYEEDWEDDISEAEVLTLSRGGKEGGQGTRTRVERTEDQLWNPSPEISNSKDLLVTCPSLIDQSRSETRNTDILSDLYLRKLKQLSFVEGVYKLEEGEKRVTFWTVIGEDDVEQKNALYRIHRELREEFPERKLAFRVKYSEGERVPQVPKEARKIA